MTLEQIKEKVKSTEYDFLRTNKHLGNNIILLGLGGSYAYGTNVETSDLDVRGCALNNKSEILTNENFEQFVNEATDTTIYSFNKLITLLSNCNPNTIEILGLKPEHYLYISPIGQELLDNKKIFLSKKAINSFGGYAHSQLRRLDNKAREIFRARIMELAKEGKNATEILEILKSENIIPKSLIGEQIIYQISYYYNKAKNEKGYENDR